jgi:hypothetical protein
MYIGDVFRQKCQQQQNTTVNIVLALATLGGATKNRNDPISVSPPKVLLSLVLLHLLLPMEQYVLDTNAVKQLS